MERPEPTEAREFVSGLPYIGEYFQPDSRVYIKKQADRYFDYLEKEIERLKEKLRNKSCLDFMDWMD